MIQLNLLPDVKMDYIKTERLRRLSLSISVLVTVAAIALLLLLLSVDGLQKKHLNDLTRNINSESSQLKNEPQISKILTVQNQLESLTALHAAKPAAAQLLVYLNQITPNNVNITDFSIDFNMHTASIAGTSTNLADINEYVDTIKDTTYTTNSNNNAKPTFSNVVLSSFGLNGGTQDPSQAASYTITLSYDPTIFDIAQNITLAVPNITTPRLQQDQSNSLFKASPSSKGGQ